MASLDELACEVIDKLIVKRGKDDIGLDDKWEEERLDTCGDWAYDLAVEVRKLREDSVPWWKIAVALGLPEAGTASANGARGAAMARKFWRAAWGRTYVGVGTDRVPEEKLDKTAGPYFSPEATDYEIIRALTGAEIEWVTRLEANHDSLIKSEQKASVVGHPDSIRVRVGPKGRYVEFFELIFDDRGIPMTGPLRSIYVDRITKVLSTWLAGQEAS